MGPREGLFLPLIEYHVGLRNSLVRQSSMPLMGQTEPIAQMLCACNGSTREIAPPTNRILCGPTREAGHPANRVLCGPARYSRTAVCYDLDGPMLANCTNVMRMQWAHARACACS